LSKRVEESATICPAREISETVWPFLSPSRLAWATKLLLFISVVDGRQVRQGEVVRITGRLAGEETSPAKRFAGDVIVVTRAS